MKIFVLAPSGIGKTSSLRNLIPATTGIINCDKKDLPLKGWKVNYREVRNSEGKVDLSASNYVATNSPGNVLTTLHTWAASPKIQTIVIDTITHMITQDYMNNTIGKDFKAYQKMGKNFYDIVQFINSCEKDIIVMGHLEKRINEMGDVVYDMKTHGKMITDLVPASYFTSVLIGEKKKKKDGQPGEFDYVFRTQSEGDDPAKSPAYFEDGKVVTALNFYEDNDIANILIKLKRFETEA
jgi:hypothetical protein